MSKDFVYTPWETPTNEPRPVAQLSSRQYFYHEVWKHYGRLSRTERAQVRRSYIALHCTPEPGIPHCVPRLALEALRLLELLEPADG